MDAGDISGRGRHARNASRESTTGVRSDKRLCGDHQSGGRGHPRTRQARQDAGRRAPSTAVDGSGGITGRDDGNIQDEATPGTQTARHPKRPPESTMQARTGATDDVDIPGRGMHARDARETSLQAPGAVGDSARVIMDDGAIPERGMRARNADHKALPARAADDSAGIIGMGAGNIQGRGRHASEQRRTVGTMRAQLGTPSDHVAAGLTGPKTKTHGVMSGTIGARRSGPGERTRSPSVGQCGRRAQGVAVAGHHFVVRQWVYQRCHPRHRRKASGHGARAHHEKDEDDRQYDVGFARRVESTDAGRHGVRGPPATFDDTYTRLGTKSKATTQQLYFGAVLKDLRDPVGGLGAHISPTSSSTFGSGSSRFLPRMCTPPCARQRTTGRCAADGALWPRCGMQPP